MSFGPWAPTFFTASSTSAASSSGDSCAGSQPWRMRISASSLSTRSWRLPARYCSTESRRRLISVAMTPTTPASSSGFMSSISRYLIALFSMRTTDSRSVSFSRIAVFMSASSCSFSAMGASVAAGSEALAHLLERALLGGEGLLLALHAGLLVVLALADLREDARLLALLLEALHGVLEGLAILDTHSGHSYLWTFSLVL